MAEDGPADPASVIQAVEEKCVLFHGVDATAYVTVEDGTRTFAIESKTFKSWLQRFSYRKGRGVLGRGLDDVVGALVARAKFEGAMQEPHRRIAPYAGGVLLHLGGEDGHVVQVTADGWDLLDATSPVPFVIPDGQGALPVPEPGGSIHDLQALGLDETDALIVAAFLIGALNPSGPYPTLGIAGPTGSGKTTLARRISSLVDPGAASLRGKPKEMQHLNIAARNARLIVIDNLTSMTQELADGICRITSGTGAGYRRGYTDDEEVLFSGSRPFVVTCISDRLFSRGDIADRTVLLRRPAIEGGEHQAERRLDREFEQRRARILGLILDGVASAVKNLDRLPDLDLPRLADFTEWFAGAAPVLGLTAEEAVDLVKSHLARPVLQEVDPVAQAVFDLAADGWGVWEGTATELLVELDRRNVERLPRAPSSLGRRLREDDVVDDMEFLNVVLDESRTGDRRLLTLSLVETTDDWSDPLPFDVTA